MTTINIKDISLRYLCPMASFKLTINDLPLLLESKNLTPEVQVYMVSIQGDPVQFPMVYRKEFGWFFVDKMTLMEFKSIEKEISDAIEAREKMPVRHQDKPEK